MKNNQDFDSQKKTLKTIRLTALFLCFLFSNQNIAFAQTKLISYVDPFIGADRDGNTVPGAAVPFGFANPSPDVVPNPNFRFDTSGYESDKPIIGFSQTHVSGTGGESKYGNFRVTPQVGEINLKDFASDKKDESAEAGYYKVTLIKPNVKAELTTTRLVAIHRYTFPKTENAEILIDTGSAIFTGGGSGRRQRPISTTTRIVAPNRIEGTGNFIGGWNPSPYTLHFSAEFSQNFKSYGTWRNEDVYPNTKTVTGEQTGAGAFVTFDTITNQSVEIKIGVSFVSSEKANANIKVETGSANFDEIRNRASKIWEETLSKIKVEGGSDEQKQIFYTALYRSHYMPHDVSGENVWWESDAPHYEDFYAIWDTFRTVHPLLTLIQPTRQRDMVRSLIDIYKHTGWMPDARIAGANGMIQGGSNADVLIADAFVKNLKGIDYETAYQAMVKNAEVDSPRSAYEGRELGEYNTRGYISTKTERSASRTVEYAYNDFCIALVAKGLGKTADFQKYIKRSKNWMNLWDAETKSIRPRTENGEWMTPFDKTKLYMLDSPRFTWMSSPYYEGSSYQYSTYVPHDVNGLIEKVGGDKAFVNWLDDFFGEGNQTLRREGLYTHVNEPDILAAFLYIHAGSPAKTQDKVRDIMRREYRTGRAGLPGNDDAGTMSSWFVWNAIGLYPNAGQDFYYIGSPIFTSSTIDLGNNRKFTIEAVNSSEVNKFIQSATLDGKPIERAWLRHSEIANGGKLVLQMSEKWSKWGNANRPPSMSSK
ncbi:MAG: glycoside hydrolase family 92 protein [Acidobacteria bacterium]|nr:glycoside hydrolase family 92 protein [Acidobacteriota bacterium]